MLSISLIGSDYIHLIGMPSPRPRCLFLYVPCVRRLSNPIPPASSWLTRLFVCNSSHATQLRDDSALIVSHLPSLIFQTDISLPHCQCSQGKPSPLLSSFKLTYYTMLNMLRRLEGSDSGTMQFVIRNSFQQFQQESQLPKVRGHTTACIYKMRTLEGASVKARGVQAQLNVLRMMSSGQNLGKVQLQTCRQASGERKPTVSRTFMVFTV